MTTAKEIMSTDFPRWAEIADVLDGPDQEVVECQSTFKEHCHWPRCDCDRIKPKTAEEEFKDGT